LKTTVVSLAKDLTELITVEFKRTTTPIVLGSADIFSKHRGHLTRRLVDRPQSPSKTDERMLCACTLTAMYFLFAIF
jgi:hypothetical protein